MRHKYTLTDPFVRSRLLSPTVHFACLLPSVMHQSPVVDRVVDFHEYVVNNWVDYDVRYPLSQWNHHETTDKQQLRMLS